MDHFSFLYMMANQSISMKLIVCGVVLFLTVHAQRAFATTYTVGDGDGWGPGYDYFSWAKGKTFHRGDVLVFEYQEGYAVQEVGIKDFKTCNGAEPLHEGINGITSIPLLTVGTHFFICGDFNMCPDGMNMTIKVT